jgi:hypothetical protein
MILICVKIYWKPKIFVTYSPHATERVIIIIPLDSWEGFAFDITQRTRSYVYIYIYIYILEKSYVGRI